MKFTLSMLPFPHYADDAPDSGGTTGWATFIGIVICLCGNVIISFALNIQRLAHERIQRKLASRQHPKKQPHQERERDGYGSRPQSQGHVERNSAEGGRTQNTGEEDDQAEGTRYLHSPLWWTGLVLMVIGETGNFVAYGFAPASIVAPLGTVAILCNAVIAPVVFHETFRLRDFTGIVLATAGAVTIVLSAKTQEEKLSPDDIWEAISQIPFLIYFTLSTILALVLIPLSRRHGEKSILIDLGLVAIFGGFTALSTKGVSSLISLELYRIFTFPIFYLLSFVLLGTAVMQVKYLNKALARFSSTQVIPTQFVMFTLSVVIGSSILYKDFNSASPSRLLKFIFGCISTFIGVYLITSKRPSPHHPKHRPSIPHFTSQIPRYASNTGLRPEEAGETAPLMMIPSPIESASSGLGETPPQFLGTSFGYHFAKPRGSIPRVVGGASTLPRERRPRDDLASAIWSRWRHSTAPSEEGAANGREGNGSYRDEARRPDATNRSQSETSPQEQEEDLWRDSVSEGSGSRATKDDRGSWARNRGYSVV